MPERFTGEPGTFAAVSKRRRRVDVIKARLRRWRVRYRWLDVAVSTVVHDASVGGGLLGSALAFRLFLWLLPAGLVVIGGLGFLVPAGAIDTGDPAAGTGVADFMSRALAQTPALHDTRWYAVVLGVVLLFWASHALAAALNTAVCLEWRIPVRRSRIRGRLTGAAVLTVALLLALGTAGLAFRLRSASFAGALVADVTMAAFWTWTWWRLQRLMPHPSDVPARRLWPGAILVGVGFQILHVVTISYLSHQIENALSLYRVLGGAASVLLWAYLSTRLITLSIALNVVLLRPDEALPAPE